MFLGWSDLFTNFAGRIGRKRYWLGVFLLIALAIAVTAVLFSVGTALQDTAFAYLAFFIQLAFLYPATALMVKRLHDRNRPDYFVAFMLGPLILKFLADLLDRIDNHLNVNALDYLLGAIIFLASLWFFIELGCMRGTIGENKYGPDPLKPAPAMSLR